MPACLNGAWRCLGCVTKRPFVVKLMAERWVDDKASSWFGMCDEKTLCGRQSDGLMTELQAGGLVSMFMAREVWQQQCGLNKRGNHS